MAVQNHEPIDINQVPHFVGTEMGFIEGNTTGDNYWIIYACPERDVWIDAVHIYHAAGVTDGTLRLYKLAAGAAGNATGSNGTVMASTYSTVTSTDDTWNALTLTTTGETLKLDAGESLCIGIDLTAGSVTDLGYCVRFHSHTTH